MIEIINNLQVGKEHVSTFKKLIEKSNELLFASPFLMNDFNGFLGDMNIQGLNAITLVTCLKPKSLEQEKNVYSMISLKDIANANKTDVHFKINNKLHGKVYLFKKDNQLFRGILTSANLTDAGMYKNHEWGVEISDVNTLMELEKQVFHNSQNRYVEKNKLDTLLEAIELYRKENPKEPQQKTKLNLNDLLGIDEKFSIEEKNNYWIKPIGYSERPISKDLIYNNKEEELIFARRPSGVKNNDILIAYAVGHRKLISVYRSMGVISQASPELRANDPIRDRWSWEITGENLTTHYGKDWFKNGLVLKDLLADFFKQNRNSKVTAAGGVTLGGLEWGHDKLRITKEFAEFIISRIEQI